MLQARFLIFSFRTRMLMVKIVWQWPGSWREVWFYTHICVLCRDLLERSYRMPHFVAAQSIESFWQWVSALSTGVGAAMVVFLG